MEDGKKALEEAKGGTEDVSELKEEVRVCLFRSVYLLCQLLLTRSSLRSSQLELATAEVDKLKKKLAASDTAHSKVQRELKDASEKLQLAIVDVAKLRTEAETYTSKIEESKKGLEEVAELKEELGERLRGANDNNDYLIFTLAAQNWRLPLSKS